MFLFCSLCCKECVILNRGETDGTSALRRKYSVLQSAKGHTLIQPDFWTSVLEKYELLNLGKSSLLLYLFRRNDWKTKIIASKPKFYMSRDFSANNIWSKSHPLKSTLQSSWYFIHGFENWEDDVLCMYIYMYTNC